jgi:hypothetical protein
MKVGVGGPPVVAIKFVLTQSALRKGTELDSPRMSAS